ncbi:MAG: Lrp/AsnC family transcriptional regulator [Gemmatimonadota bacterium]
MSDLAELDRIDRAILVQLAKNARATNKEVAGEVGLSQSACLERIRRLVNRGVVRGWHADVAPEAFGIGVRAMVSIQLKKHTRAAVARFEAAVLDVPQVVALYHTTGQTDFLAHVVARDMDQLRDFTLDAITSLPQTSRVETSLIFRSTEKRSWPDLQGDA